jgi:hypothetical protein
MLNSRREYSRMKRTNIYNFIIKFTANGASQISILHNSSKVSSPFLNCTQRLRESVIQRNMQEMVNGPLLNAREEEAHAFLLELGFLVCATDV